MNLFLLLDEKLIAQYFAVLQGNWCCTNLLQMVSTVLTTLNFGQLFCVCVEASFWVMLAVLKLNCFAVIAS